MSDSALMEKFEQEVWSKVPHREEKDGKVEIVNATPLTDLTEDLKVFGGCLTAGMIAPTP